MSLTKIFWNFLFFSTMPTVVPFSLLIFVEGYNETVDHGLTRHILPEAGTPLAFALALVAWQIWYLVCYLSPSPSGEAPTLSN
jgi:hypothetical protein